MPLRSKRISTGTASRPQFTPAWQQAFRRRVLNWYDAQARELPWRGTRDPYAIWVSEVMLQQTQVVTVCSYWPRFMARFPDVGSLAAADEQEVLQMWEGLGYYRRARQMHRAAREIVENHAGQFPRDAEMVRRLPGIGRYTAGAILSIAFDAREPIVEANTVRLYSRLLGYRGDPRGGAGQRLMWEAAERWLPARRAGAFNQALMELGSEVCLPRGARCGECVVALLCAARRDGAEDEIPLPAKRPVVIDVHEAAVVVRRRGKVLLGRREGDGRWAGLWDFPRLVVHAKHGPRREGELIDGVAALTGLAIEPGRRLTTIKHGVTRFRITLDCYEAEAVTGGKATDGWRWLAPGELADYPLNVAARRLARLVAGDAPQGRRQGVQA